MIYRRSRLAFAAALLLAGVPAAAGPWSLERGRVYLKLAYGELRTNTLANPDGSEAEIPRFVKQELALYGAVGLGRGLTAFTSVPAWRSSDLEDFRRESGFGDLQAGLQWQAARRRAAWALAVRATLQAPTGDETRASGLLPTGSGIWEGTLRLSAGRSLAGGALYAFVEAGPQLRQTLRDGFVYGGQLGWNASRRLVLAIGLEGQQPWDTRAPAVALGSPVGVGDRVAYLNLGPTAIVKLGSGLALQVDLVASAAERNLAAGTTLRGGLSFSR